MTKICSKCKTEKETDGFFKDKTKKDGCSSFCKTCDKARLRDKEKKKEMNRKYREANLKKIKEYEKQRWQANMDEAKERNRIYREKNRETLNAKCREYHKIHKKELTKKATERNKLRRQIDINYRLKLSLRSRLHEALNGRTKLEATIKLLGCSVPELEVYLESKFINGMSWSNYGRKGWHIDHIVPCNSFDLTKLEEQQKCFHYTNLQPLWYLDNLIKGDKVIDYARP